MDEEIDEVLRVLEQAEELVTPGQFRLTLTQAQLNLISEILEKAQGKGDEDEVK